MCRLICCKSRDPVHLDDLLIKPAHSIINQAFDSWLRIDQHRPLNGDGFGMGWYDGTPGTSPCVFTSVLPAWNNPNLTRLASKTVSPLLFAHVRAASPGLPISETNCHPFQHGVLLFMHNGYIADFSKIKRSLLNRLEDRWFQGITGSTDSEHMFALFLQALEAATGQEVEGRTEFGTRELKEALERTIRVVVELVTDAGIQDPSLLNLVVSDGTTLVCSRYITSKTYEGASLFYSSGSRFEEFAPGRFRMLKHAKHEEIVVISSEPLTFERTDWLRVPNNCILVVTPNVNVVLFPVKDQFWRDLDLSRKSAGAARTTPWWGYVEGKREDGAERAPAVC